MVKNCRYSQIMFASLIFTTLFLSIFLNLNRREEYESYSWYFLLPMLPFLIISFYYLHKAWKTNSLTVFPTNTKEALLRYTLVGLFLTLLYWSIWFPSLYHLLVAAALGFIVAFKCYYDWESS